jgi:oxepin-CoA hydrolase/3-oxo-5,6-dehydrosuberyl-CoA semialdehyde dehydrogenase
MTIRSRKNFLERGVRVNVEADSLNAAILGPDVDASSPVFDLFVREVVKDMTQKAGQKCTAIRRVFVPAAILADAREALIAEIKAQKAGDPSASGVRVGPVATKQQYDDVRAGIARLATQAKAVHGNGGRGTLVGVDHDKGFFVEPTLFEAADARAATVVHEHEVFGPVQTLMPYSGEASEVVDLVRLGQGGLVSSVYADDQAWLEQVVLGIATHHGRVNIGSTKVADYSAGPGTALPQLLHGGPGRAGGGEELGGVRGLGFYTQRTAIQGYRPIIERLLGLDPAAS